MSKHQRSVFTTPLGKILAGCVMFALICGIAIYGYMSAGWGLVDSIYMVIITIFGVGYGEVRPVETTGLRAITILLIVAGYGAVIYIVGGFAQMLIDGELDRVLGARRMTKEIGSLRQHTIITGMGRLGTILGEQLEAAGREFVVVDSNEDLLSDARDRGWLIVTGDATDETTLEAAAISHASTLASVTSDDAINVFVTITAREMNPDITIIARGENPRTERKLIRCGANTVILPTAVGAQRVAQLIIRPSAESLLASSLAGQDDALRRVVEDLSLCGLDISDLVVADQSPLAGRPLSDLEVRGNQGFLIIGIRTRDGVITPHPPVTTVLSGGDTIVVLAHKNEIPELAARVAQEKSTPAMKYRGVSID